MAVIGITGGIASGKSTFTRALSNALAARVFDADACARTLLNSDPGVRERVVRDILPTAYLDDGKPDRKAIRKLVFSNPSAKARLEAILHPRVRESWQAMAEESRARGGDLLVDIPLLFETGAANLFDAVVTVACSPEIQLQRITSRGLTPLEAAQITASQWDNGRKIALADFVVWNDGSLRVLEAQASRLASRLKSRAK